MSVCVCVPLALFSQSYLELHRELIIYMGTKDKDTDIQEVIDVPVKSEPRDGSAFGGSYNQTSMVQEEILDVPQVEEQHALEPYEEGVEYEDYGQYETEGSQGKYSLYFFYVIFYF